jgi:hypothetical protein
MKDYVRAIPLIQWMILTPNILKLKPTSIYKKFIAENPSEAKRKPVNGRLELTHDELETLSKLMKMQVLEVNVAKELLYAKVKEKYIYDTRVSNLKVFQYLIQLFDME